MKIRGYRILFASLLLVAAVACSELIKGLTDAAAQLAIDAVKANGGVAGIVSAGQPFELKFEDESSPLFGTQVNIPADGLPEDVDSAILSIEQSDFQPPDPDIQRPIGPPAEIRLRAWRNELDGFSEERIALRRQATVQMPYDVTQVAADQVSNVELGHQMGTEDTAMTILVGSTADPAAGLVSGQTETFSPFQAILVGASTALPAHETDQQCGLDIETTDSRTDVLFDAQGRITMETVWGAVSTGSPFVDDDAIYVYGESGALESITGTTGRALVTVTTTTGESGRVSRQIMYEGPFLAFDRGYTYAEDGRTTAVADLTDTDTNFFTYANNRLVQVRTATSEGATASFCLEFTYTDDGALQELASYSGECGGEIGVTGSGLNCSSTDVMTFMSFSILK